MFVFYEQKRKGDTMAIDPATFKIVAHIATSIASDEKGRWAIFIACLLPLGVILFVLSSPFAIYFAVVDGQILVVHCSSGANNVVVTTAKSAGFIYYRRPAILME
jgi:hypothetical protein